MSSKRDLKRTINYICSDLFAECVAASLYGNQKSSTENTDALLTSILLVHSDYVRRISHPEPGIPQKKFYKILIEDFNKQVDGLIDQIANLA